MSLSDVPRIMAALRRVLASGPLTFEGAVDAAVVPIERFTARAALWSMLADGEARRCNDGRVELRR